MSHLKHWSDDWRRWGTGRFLHKRLMQAVRPRLVLARVYVRELRRQPAAPDADDGLQVRVLDREALLAAAADPALGLHRGFLDGALQRGDMSVGAFQGERLVAYTWQSFTRVPHRDGLWVSVEPPYRYAYKSFTLPEYRGRHLLARLSVHLDDYCLEHGRTHSIGFIESHNYPSRVAYERTGSFPGGWVGYLLLGGRGRPFRSPEARQRRFGFIPAPEPELAAAGLPEEF